MKKEHILVIRLSAMGDVALSVPVLTAFSRQYPKVRLTVLTRALFAPIFAHLPNCEVVTPDLKGKHKGLKGLFRLYKELKSRQITAVADLHNVLRSNVLKAFFKCNGIPFFQIDKGRREKKALVRAKNKKFAPLKPTCLRYADVFQKLGYPVDLQQPVFAPKPAVSPEVAQIFLPQKKYVGIAPFAAHLGKQYPLEKMKIIVQELSQNPDIQIFLFGGGVREKELLSAWEALPQRVNLVGKFAFGQELEIISHLHLMLSMDSGNAHLAAMYGVPTLTLWGVTHPYAGFAPYAQPSDYCLLPKLQKFPKIPTSVYGNKFPQGYEKAIETIAPEVVTQKINQILNTKNN